MLGQQESVEEARVAVILRHSNLLAILEPVELEKLDQHLGLLAMLEPMEAEKLDQHAEKSWQLLAVLLVVKRSCHRLRLPSTIRLACLDARYHQSLS